MAQLWNLDFYMYDKAGYYLIQKVIVKKEIITT